MGELSVADFRRELLELCGRAVPFAGETGDDEPVPDGGVPTAVLIVVEWQGDDGHRWLSSTSALGSGQIAPIWTARALAYEALHWEADDK